MRPGEGVRCDWEGSRTGRSVTLPPPSREGATRAVIVTGGVGALDGAEQTESQGDIEAPEGLGGASGSGD